MTKNLFAVILLLAVTGVWSCTERKGPLERAGERTDEIIDNVKDGDPILHKKGAAEKTGEAIDDTIKDLKKSDH